MSVNGAPEAFTIIQPTGNIIHWSLVLCSSIIGLLTEEVLLPLHH